MERELRKAGPLDQTLADAGLAPPSGDVLSASSEMVWGSRPGPSQFLKSFDGVVSQFASDSGREALSDFLRGDPYVAVAGLFGNPDEIERSGSDALAAVKVGDLEKGRRLYQFGLAMADCAARGNEFLPPNDPPALGEALSKAARTLRESDQWCVAGLAACAIAAFRAKIDRT